MTRTVSRALQPICTSTALAKDIVPRLGVATFERLREDMVRAWECSCGLVVARLSVSGLRWTSDRRRCPQNNHHDVQAYLRLLCGICECIPRLPHNQVV